MWKPDDRLRNHPVVHGRAVGDLTLTVGSQVVTCGSVERTQSPERAIIWVRDPWEPEHARRYAHGEVAVSTQGSQRMPDEGAVVQVRGSWTGTEISQALFSPIQRPAIHLACGPTDRLTPGELDTTTFLAVSSAIDSASPSQISSGATDEAVWAYVLYMTRNLERVQRDSPARIDIFTAITPRGLLLSGARAAQ